MQGLQTRPLYSQPSSLSIIPQLFCASLTVRKDAESLSRPRHLDLARTENQNGNTCTERKLEIHRGSLSHIQQSIDQHMHVTKLAKTKERTSPQILRVLGVLVELRIQPVLTSHTGNLMTHNA